MILPIITFIVVLVCFAFIKSTIIIPLNSREEERPPKVSIPLFLVCAASSFIPYINVLVIVIVPIITLIWFASNGFQDEPLKRKLEINKETILGKILLSKI